MIWGTAELEEASVFVAFWIGVGTCKFYKSFEGFRFSE